MVSSCHIRQYSSRLFSNLPYWHFLPLVPISYSLPVSHSMWILSSPTPLPPALFVWLQARIFTGFSFWALHCHNWSLISLPSFTPWINPHYVYTYKWTFIQVSLCWRMELCYVLSSLYERSRKALHMLDPLLLLEPVLWITSLQTHSQKLRTADVYLLFESQGKKFLHRKPFFPPPRPNKLKLVDFSSLIDACFFTGLF